MSAVPFEAARVYFFDAAPAGFFLPAAFCDASSETRPIRRREYGGRLDTGACECHGPAFRQQYARHFRCSIEGQGQNRLSDCKRCVEAVVRTHVSMDMDRDLESATLVERFRHGVDTRLVGIRKLTMGETGVEHKKDERDCRTRSPVGGAERRDAIDWIQRRPRDAAIV